MKKRKAMQLVRALRSGKHKQGQLKLHLADDSKCCLGVACAIAASRPVKRLDGAFFAYDGERAVLPETVMHEFGFAYHDGTRRDNGPVRINGDRYLNLADANDSGVSFRRIATYIEKNWEAL